MHDKLLLEGLILEEVRGGKSIASVARRFGMVTSTVFRICERAGVKSKHPVGNSNGARTARNEQIVNAIRSGNFTLGQVGAMYGITSSRVGQICARENVFSFCYKNDPLSPEEEESIEAQWARGIRPAHMALGGRDASTARRHLGQKGLREPEHDMTPWGESEIELLKREYGTPHISAADIARKLGRTRNEVIGRAHRLGLKAREKRNNQMLVSLNGETHNVSEWARKLGIQRNTIRARLRTGWTPEQALGLGTGHRRNGTRMRHGC